MLCYVMFHKITADIWIYYHASLICACTLPLSQKMKSVDIAYMRVLFTLSSVVELACICMCPLYNTSVVSRVTQLSYSQGNNRIIRIVQCSFIVHLLEVHM